MSATYTHSKSPSRFISTKQAAAYLNLSEPNLRTMRKSGGGPRFYKFGKIFKYTVSDLDSWAESQLVD